MGDAVEIDASSVCSRRPPSRQKRSHIATGLQSVRNFLYWKGAGPICVWNLRIVLLARDNVVRKVVWYPSSTKSFEQIGDRWRYGSAFAAMGGVENTLRTRRFQWRLPKDPMIGSRSLRESAIPHAMVLVIIYETTAAYHRALLENSRRTTITNVLENGGRICGGCNDKEAWVRVNQRAC